MVKKYLSSLLKTSGIAPSGSNDDNQALADVLGERIDMTVYPRSIAGQNGVIFFFAKNGVDKYLCFASEASIPAAFGAKGKRARLTELELLVAIVPPSHERACALRQHLPFTAASVFGVRKALGTGDRLGLATPGHVRAVRGSGVVPYFAQQSIREMSRTHRTPEEVMDTATWGVFQCGWREGFGSDADHLKTTDDIDACFRAGFTFYTVDPGDHVDNEADRLDKGALAHRFEQLPWGDLESTASDCRAAYAGKDFPVGSELTIHMTDEAMLRAAVKYGKAIAHATRMYRHLKGRMGDKPFELEMSVDETHAPTTVPDHYFVASELRRLGVEWVSLAPRFIGEFEKGVDYKGSLNEFEAAFLQHVAIAKHFGPYKISLHSGSDKFSVYPIAARHAGELVHVKTAGTSYLEALRAIGQVAPGLFREILAFAFKRYDEDKATYHVSADPGKVPTPDRLKDGDLPGVLDLFDGRQLLHVTYGSVLTWEGDEGFYFRDRILSTLRENEDAHYAVLEKHLGRHVAPFKNV
ncbi:MAG: tagaturonate epimerase family protein [Planctomycetota bacterium]